MRKKTAKKKAQKQRSKQAKAKSKASVAKRRAKKKGFKAKDSEKKAKETREKVAKGRQKGEFTKDLTDVDREWLVDEVIIPSLLYPKEAYAKEEMACIGKKISLIETQPLHLFPDEFWETFLKSATVNSMINMIPRVLTQQGRDHIRTRIPMWISDTERGSTKLEGLIRSIDYTIPFVSHDAQQDMKKLCQNVYLGDLSQAKTAEKRHDQGREISHHGQNKCQSNEHR